MDKAPSFDKKNNYVEIANNNLLNFGEADGYTLMCWMKTNTTDKITDYTGLVSKAIATKPLIGWQLLIFDNCLAAEIFGSDKSRIGPKQGLEGTTPLNDGQWHNVAITVNRQAGTAVLYVDGVAEKTITNDTLKNNPDNTASLLIGVERTKSFYFSGSLEHVDIWSRALDIHEIQYFRNNVPATSTDKSVSGFSFNRDYPGVTDTGRETTNIVPNLTVAAGDGEGNRSGGTTRKVSPTPSAAMLPSTLSVANKSVKKSPTARLTRISRSQRRRDLPDTPDYLIPRMGKLPVSDAMHFVTAHLISGKGSADAKVFSGPLKLKPVASAQLPATGALLTHEQGWYARGLSLGNLLHSITLAPGEVTQVAVVEWHRQESGSAQESTQQDDSTSEADQRNRAVDDVQQSTLSEVQKGGSFAASSSVDAEAGFSLPFFGSAGGGANTTTGVSTNYSDGTRDLSLSENQKINEATMRNAQASRSRRAAVVRETSQAESEQLTTRVVANYNHAHALTMMYFEVVEVFDLTTKVIDAERLIYLPMEIAEIDEGLFRRFGGQFAQAAESRGDAALAGDIRSWIKSHPLAPAFSLQDPVRLDLMYNDKNSGSTLDGSFYRTVAPDDCFSLGDYAHASYDDPNLQSIRVIKPLEKDVVRYPVDFERVWIDKGSGAKMDGSFWRPIPQPGYVALGTVAQKGYDKPDIKVVVCVREDLVAPAMVANNIWLNKKGEDEVRGDSRFAAWAVEPADSSGLRCGTFLGRADSWDRPSNDSQLPCLKEDRNDKPDKSLREILARLNREKLFYNQVMWVSQEPGAVIESLRDVKWPSDATRALSESVDPRPVTLTGNYVGYRWHFDDNRQRNKFLKQYIDSFNSEDSEETMSHSVSIAVATGGVFGEAVLGQAVSAEKIDLTRFWKWQDSPIPILPSQISPLSAGGRARDVSTSTGQLSDSAARLDQLTALPDPSGFSAASQMMTSNIFRDMSGSSVVQALALDASKHAADGADNAAKLASENFDKFMEIVKDLGLAAMQKGGMDSTTLGGMQPDPEEEVEGGGAENIESHLTGGGDEAGGAELGEAVGPEVEEAAEVLPMLAL